MLWYGVLIYVVVAYAVFSTLFTPILALAADPGLKKQAGAGKMVFNIICIVTGNVAMLFLMAGFKSLIPLMLCTFVGEVILWFILRGIVKNDVVQKFNNKACGFYPIYQSGGKTFLLQPLYWLNTMAPEDIEIGGILKIVIIPVLAIVGIMVRGPELVPVDKAVPKTECAIIIVDKAVSIKSIGNDAAAYTKNGKKWEFAVKGDGLYVPEGGYLFVCDFSKTEKQGKTKLNYVVNDLKVVGNMVKGKTYFLKYNLEKLQDNKFRVSLLIEEG